MGQGRAGRRVIGSFRRKAERPCLLKPLLSRVILEQNAFLSPIRRLCLSAHAWDHARLGSAGMNIMIARWPWHEWRKHAFLCPEHDKAYDVICMFVLGLFYLLGYLLWSDFFYQGHMTFKSLDWIEKFRALRAMREAVTLNVVPYQLAKPLSAWHASSFLLALPHVIVSPQLLLLKYMREAQFVLWNVRLFYTIGFFGCILLARRMRLSIVAIGLLLLLFNFNGHVTAHLGEGHAEWFGYFLLPWFIYYALDLAEDKPVWLPSLAIGMVNCLMLLQGAFHFVVWIMMFLGFMWLFKPSRRMAKAILTIACASALLGAIRLGPAMLLVSIERLSYVPGYPTPSVLLESLVVIRTHLYPRIQVAFAAYPVYWWEYDMYVSEIGLAFLLVFGVWPFFSPKAARRERPIFAEFGWPMACLFALSLGHLFLWLFYQSGFPIVSTVERAPSRFIIMPMCFLFAFACLNFQRFLNRKALGLSHGSLMAIFIGIGVLAGQLYMHAQTWSVYMIDHSSPDPDYSPIHIVGGADPFYVNVVKASALVSVMSLAAWIGIVAWIAWKNKATQKRLTQTRQAAQ
jgi:hypothetical protein